MRIVAAIGILASLGCTWLAAQAGKRFSLSGTVVDGGSKRPLANVEVSLHTEHWGPAGDSIFSDSQGRFAFTGLAAGEYILSANGPGFGTVRYGESTDPGWVSTVEVGKKGADKSLVFSIAPRASLEGLVRDEFGDPIMHASVIMLRSIWRDGRTTTANAGQGSTDDRGHYRMSELAPGQYIVCTGQNMGSPPAVGPVDFAARIENRAYVRTCYPDGGGSLLLAPGQHAQIDLTPLVGSTATVSGRVRNLPPQTGFSAYLQSEEGVAGNTSTDPAQGTFTIRGVPPGRYQLHVYSTSSVPMAGARPNISLPVEVGGSDISGLDVSLDSGGVFDVAVHGEADAAKVAVSLRTADAYRTVFVASPAKEGAIHLEGLPTGRYWVDTHTQDDVCVVSIKVGDREVRGGTVDIATGARQQAELTLSTHCGSIRARAVREGEPVPNAKAVLLLSGTPKDPGDMLEDFTSDEGELTFTGLAPGRYLLWAWDVQGPGATAGPASLAAVEPQATVVEVTAGEPVHIDVPLLRGEGKAQ